MGPGSFAGWPSQHLQSPQDGENPRWVLGSELWKEMDFSTMDQQQPQSWTWALVESVAQPRAHFWGGKQEEIAT